VTDFVLPTAAEQLAELHKVVMGFESARALAWEYADHAGKLSDALKGLEAGWSVTRADYDSVRQTTCACRRALVQKMRPFDFLMTLGAP
jgi:hypothetical protein